MQKQFDQFNIREEPKQKEPQEEQKKDNQTGKYLQSDTAQVLEIQYQMQDKAVNIGVDQLGKNSDSSGKQSSARNVSPNQDSGVNIIQTESILVPQNEEKKDQQLKISDIETPRKQGNLTSQISEVQSGSIPSANNSSIVKNRSRKLASIASPEKSAELTSSPEAQDDFATLRQESPVKRLNMVLSMADVKDFAPNTPNLDEEVLSQIVPSQPKVGKRFDFNQDEVGDKNEGQEVPMELSAGDSSQIPNNQSQDQKQASSLSGYTDLTNSNLAESQQPNNSGPLAYSYSLGADSMLISPASVTGIQPFDQKYDVSQNIPFQTILKQETDKLKLNHVLELRSLQDVIKQKQKEIIYLQDVIANQKNQTQETQNIQKMNLTVQEQEKNFKSELERRDLKIKRLEAEIENLKKEKPMDNNSGVELELYELRIKLEIKEFELTAKFNEEISQLKQQLLNSETQRQSLLDENHKLMEQVQLSSQKIRSQDEMENKIEDLQKLIQMLSQAYQPPLLSIEEEIKKQTMRLKEILTKIEDTLIKENSLTELNRINDYLVQRLMHTQQIIQQLQDDLNENKLNQTINLEELKQYQEKSRQLEKELQSVKVKSEKQIEEYRIKNQDLEEEIQELNQQLEALQRKSGRNYSQPSPISKPEQIEDSTKVYIEALKHMVEESMKTVNIREVRIKELEEQISDCVIHVQRLSLLEQEKSTFKTIENDLRSQINTLNNKLQFYLNQIEKLQNQQKSVLQDIPADPDISFGTNQLEAMKNQIESLEDELNQSQQALERTRQESTDGVKEFNQQIDILQSVLEKKESEMIKMQQEIDRLQKAIEQNENGSQTIREQLLIQQQLSLEQKQQLQQLNDEIKKLQTYLNQLNQEKNVQEQKISEIQKEIKILETQKREIFKQNEDLQAKNQLLIEKQITLEKELEIAIQKINEMKIGQNQAQDLNQKLTEDKIVQLQHLKEKQELVAELEKQLIIQNDRIKNLEDTISQGELEIMKQKQENFNLAQKLDTLSQKQEELDQQIQQAENLNEILNQQLVDERKKLGDELDRLKVDLQISQDRLIQMNESSQIKEEQMIKLNKELDQLRQENSNLNSQVAQNFKEKQELQKDLENLNQQIQEKSLVIQQLQQKLKETQQIQFNQEKVFCEENQNLKAEISQLIESSKQFEQEAQMLKIKLEDQIEQLHNVQLNYDREIQILQLQKQSDIDKNAQLERETQAVKDQLINLKNENETTSQQLLKAQSELTQTNSLLEEVKHQLQKAHDKVKDQQESLDTTERLLNQSNIQLDKVQTENRDLSLKLQALQEDQDQLQQQNLLQKQQIKNLCDQEQRLLDELAQLKQLQTHIGDNEQKITVLLEEINQKQQTLRAQEGQLMQLENKLNEQQKDFLQLQDSSQKQQESLNEKVESRNEIIEIQRQQLEKMTNDLDESQNLKKQLTNNLDDLQGQILSSNLALEAKTKEFEEINLILQKEKETINQLQKTLRETDDESQRKNKLIDELQEQIQLTSIENRELSTQKLLKEDQLKAIEKSKEKALVELENLSQEMKSLQSNLKEGQILSDSQKSQIEQLQKTNSELLKQIQDTQKQIQDVSDNFKLQQDQNDVEKNNLRQQLEDLQNKLDKQEVKAQDERQLVSKLKSQIDQMKSESLNQDNIFQMQEDKINQLTQQIQQLKSQSRDESQLTGELQQLETELQNIKRQYLNLETTNTKLLGQQEMMLQQLAESKDQISKGKEQQEELMNALSEASKKSQHLIDQIQLLQGQQKSSELYKINLEQVNKKLSEDYEATKLQLLDTQSKFMDSLLRQENLQSQIEQANKDKIVLEQTIRKLHQDLEVYEDESQKYQDGKLQISILNSQIDELTSQIQEQKHELDQIKNQNKQLLESQNQFEDQTDQINSLKEQIGMLKQQNQNLQALIKSKNQEISGLSQNIEQYIQNLNDQQDLVNTVTAIQDEIKKKDELILQLQLQNRELQEQDQKQQERIDFLHDQRQSKEHEITKLKQTQDEVFKLKDLSRQLQKQIDQLKKEEQAKNTLLLQQKQQSSSFKKELQVSEQQRENLKALLEQQQGSILQKDLCISNHQKTIESLQQQILANKKGFEKKINDLSLKLSQSELQVKDLLRQSSNAYEMTQNTVLELKGENQQLQDRCQEIEQRYIDLQGLYQQLQNNPINETIKDQEKYDNLIQVLQQENGQYQHQLFEMKRDYEAQIKHMRSKLLDSGKYSRLEAQKIRDLSAQNEALSATVLKLTEHSDYLQDQLQKYSSDQYQNQVDIREELVESVAENKKLQQQLQRQNGQIYSYKKIIMDLEKRFTDLNKQSQGRSANSFLQASSPASVSPQPQNYLVYSKTSESKVIKRPFKETQSQNDIYRSVSQEKQEDPKLTFELKDSRVDSLKRSLQQSVKKPVEQANYYSLKNESSSDKKDVFERTDKARIQSMPGSGKTPEKLPKKRPDKSFLKQIRPTSVQFKQTPKKNVLTPQRERPLHRQSQSTSDDYKGDIQNGLRHGRGRFVYPNGDVYEGEWYKDQRYGYGSLKNQKGDVYLGYWQFDQMNGCGHLKNTQPEQSQVSLDYKNLDTIGNKWLSYQGEFQQGLFHGYGTLTLTNSERFHGSFAKGKANGRGTFYRMNGEIIPGQWKNNYFIDRNLTK